MTHRGVCKFFLKTNLRKCKTERKKEGSEPVFLSQMFSSFYKKYRMQKETNQFSHKCYFYTKNLLQEKKQNKIQQRKKKETET